MSQFSQTGLVSELTLGELSLLLKKGLFTLKVGNLTIRCKTSIHSVCKSLHTLYQYHTYQVDPDFADFYVELSTPVNLRRWLRKQVEFKVDGERPFEPLPYEQAPAFFEWGLNWIIAASCQQWLTIHAASLEKNGRVLILPAPPGSGKSTLCAALAFNGWRLFSDELTLLDIETRQAQPLARPINLKNESIDVIKKFITSIQWSPEIYDTIKGRVTHLVPSQNSVLRAHEVAKPQWVVFPKYIPNSDAMITIRSKPATCIDLAKNGFNYSVLGADGFNMVADLVDSCICYDFNYSQLEDAVEIFEQLSERD